MASPPESSERSSSRSRSSTAAPEPGPAAAPPPPAAPARPGRWPYRLCQHCREGAPCRLVWVTGLPRPVYRCATCSPFDPAQHTPPPAALPYSRRPPASPPVAPAPPEQDAGGHAGDEGQGS